MKFLFIWKYFGASIFILMLSIQAFSQSLSKVSGVPMKSDQISDYYSGKQFFILALHDMQFEYDHVSDIFSDHSEQVILFKYK